MYVNDMVLPAPGSLVTPSASGRVPVPVYVVVASSSKRYAGNWVQYDITLLANNRLLILDEESISFHNDWHVIHRP